MNKYQTKQSKKNDEEIKKLSTDQAILKAVDDAKIDLQGLSPVEVYNLVLDRINNSEYTLD